MAEYQMTDAETAAHLRRWVRREVDRGLVFGWATDACGYDQHMRFVKHRNANWSGGTREDFDRFVLAYADALAPEPTNAD